MKLNVTRAQERSTRVWHIDLPDDAPMMPFLGIGDGRPGAARVVEEIHDGRRTLTVELAPDRIGAPETRVFYAQNYDGWADQDHHVDHLPSDLLAGLLAACGGITVPRKDDNA